MKSSLQSICYNARVNMRSTKKLPEPCKTRDGTRAASIRFLNLVKRIRCNHNSIRTEGSYVQWVRCCGRPDGLWINADRLCIVLVERPTRDGFHSLLSRRGETRHFPLRGNLRSRRWRYGDPSCHGSYFDPKSGKA